jgi:hypothetical protein
LKKRVYCAPIHPKALAHPPKFPKKNICLIKKIIKKGTM